MSTRDTPILLGAAAAFLTVRPLLEVQSPTVALAMLLPGWDNASHFSMFLEQRTAGTAPPFLPSAADSGSYFANYPQWHHSLLVGIARVASGPKAGSISLELVEYAHLQAIVFILLVITVIAASIPKPGAPPRQIASWSIASSVVLGVPGAQSVVEGHVNFLVAASSVGLIVLIGSPRETESMGVICAAVCGLLIVIGNWPLLLPIGIAASIPTLWRVAGSRERRSGILCAIVLGAATTLTLYSVLTAVGSDAAQHLNVDGSVFRPTLLSALILPMSAIAVGYVTRNRAPSSGRVLGLVSLIGLSQTIAVALIQLLSTGELRYYFWKMSSGIQAALIIVAIPLITTGSVESKNGAVPRPRTHSFAVPGAFGVLLGALGLGFFAQDQHLPSAIWPVAARSLWANSAVANRDDAAMLLHISRATESSKAVQTTLIATKRGYPNAALTNQWFHTLTRTRTVTASSHDSVLNGLGNDPDKVDPEHVLKVAQDFSRGGLAIVVQIVGYSCWEAGAVKQCQIEGVGHR